MNLGQLFDDAARALQSAAASMTHTGPTDTMDVLTALRARADVYAGLARCVSTVAGGTLTVERELAETDAPLATANVLMRRAGQYTNKLYAGLQAASGTRLYPPASASSSTASAHLQSAAQSVGAAADLLASHVDAGRLRSMEAIAMQTGSSVREGLALVSHATLVAIQVDATVPRWLAKWSARIEVPGTDVADPRLAQWATSSNLRRVAQRLQQRGSGIPDLRSLTPAPPASEHFAAPVSHEARLAAARDWLLQHDDLIDATHLRTGSQLGLAVSLLADMPDRLPWRAAARAATHLNSPPPHGQAHHVATELADLAAEIRAQPQGGRPSPRDKRLWTAVPDLARALRRGLILAMARQAIHVAHIGLSPTPVKLIYRCQTTMRPATLQDRAIVMVFDGLTTASRPMPGHTSVAQFAQARKGFATAPAHANQPPILPGVPPIITPWRGRQR